MPVLQDQKHEKFAQLCARGMPASEAYYRAGFNYNTGNAATFRKRPQIQARIKEIQDRLAEGSDLDVHEYVKEQGVSPAYIVKQILDTALAAKRDGKYDIALKGFHSLGAELFGMFVPRTAMLDKLNTTNSAKPPAIDFTGLNQAIALLGNPSAGPTEILGSAERVPDDGGDILPPPDKPNGRQKPSD